MCLNAQAPARQHVSQCGGGAGTAHGMVYHQSAGGRIMWGALVWCARCVGLLAGKDGF